MKKAWRQAGRICMRVGVVLLAASAPLRASGEEIVRNWFDDPFFQVRAAIADCPLPLGPYGTEGDRMRETHYRNERGLRCYLEKKCTKPSSYMYDADIAAAIKARFEKSALLKDSSLWVTAQRRFAYVEGCVSSPRAAGEIRRLLKDVPDLEQTIINVTRDWKSPLPYRVVGPGQRRVD